MGISALAGQDLISPLGVASLFVSRAYHPCDKVESKGAHEGQETLRIKRARAATQGYKSSANTRFASLPEMYPDVPLDLRMCFLSRVLRESPTRINLK